MAEDASLSIVVCSPPGLGHLIPLVRIAEKLLEQGHRVTFIAFDFAEEALRRVLPQGAECMCVKSGYDSEAAFQASAAARKIFFAVVMNELLARPLLELLPTVQPSIVLADMFLTHCCHKATEQLGLPLAISFPGSLSMLHGALCFGPSPGVQVSCCGVHAGLALPGGFFLFKFLNLRGIGGFFSAMGKGMGRSLILVQSHWGLDRPQALPANVKVVGAVTDPPTEALAKLHAKAPELCEWLARPGPAIVVVSTGSVAELLEWQVAVIRRGLRRAGVRAVWSLKEAQQAWVPERDGADLFLSAWLPQAELLHHEKVSCVITHCGWGGTLEVTGAGKPAVAIPFFGDQMGNSRLMIRAGMAEPIGKLPRQGFAKNRYKEGMITEESIAAAVAKVLGDTSYAENARRVSAASRTMGGAREAAFHVEMGARHGVRHCCDERLWRRTTGSNPLNLLGCLSALSLLVSGICGAL